MLIEEKELSEIYFLKHRNDSNFKTNENDLLDKSLSPYIFNNNTMSNYLKSLQVLIYKLFDSKNVVRNFNNPTVDKYEYRHLD